MYSSSVGSLGWRMLSKALLLGVYTRHYSAHTPLRMILLDLCVYYFTHYKVYNWLKPYS